MTSTKPTPEQVTVLQAALNLQFSGNKLKKSVLAKTGKRVKGHYVHKLISHCTVSCDGMYCNRMFHENSHYREVIYRTIARINEVKFVYAF